MNAQKWMEKNWAWLVLAVGFGASALLVGLLVGIRLIAAGFGAP